ncbi:MAG: hypothetical protein FI737_05770 [SAR202 cluster bacterium]|nr:hypothetical protein [SAR202 cluster bacterium]|tara:strand:- start:1642 stop:1953 length:312 start_codon:yes stop_codon:yes gene_type:complete
MLSGGIFPRVVAYAVLALGFWLLFQAFEKSNILSGVMGGLLIIVGMYLMTGVWKDLFAKFGAGNYRIRKENDASDDTLKDRIDGAGGTGDSFDGSDEGSQLPP